MAQQNLKLKTKSTGSDGKIYWENCGVVFVTTDEAGNITSASVKHNMFPNVEMVAFPKKAQSEENNDGLGK